MTIGHVISIRYASIHECSQITVFKIITLLDPPPTDVTEKQKMKRTNVKIVTKIHNGSTINKHYYYNLLKHLIYYRPNENKRVTVYSNSQNIHI
jgi:hypothetical protein